jgi:hypothetical protein
MRKTLMLLSLGLLGAALALAQDAPTADQPATPPANNTDTSASAGSVQGCLSGSDGNYMLTQDGTGTTFKLMGDEIQLKKHVGHEVSITGQASGDTASASNSPQGQGDTPASGTTDTGTTIQVTNVKMVSKQCMGSGSQSR